MRVTPLREITIEGDVGRIPLPCGRVAIIDAGDIGLVSNRNWTANRSRNVIYVSSNGFVTDTDRCIRLHRLILGAPKGSIIDHIDGDGLNNRRSNLRLATASENSWNSGLYANNTSGFKGVHKVRDAWVSVIKHQGVRRFLGYFETAEEAGVAYLEAARKLRPDFIRSEVAQRARDFANDAREAVEA